MICIQTYTWQMTRKELFLGTWTQGKPLATKKCIKFNLPVGCQNRKNPQVFLRVVPCENMQSRHISIEGELLIQRKCSRYKWLVEYCQCSVLLKVVVIDPLTNVDLGSSEEEFDIEYSVLNQDHHTALRLRNVLNHNIIFYDDSISTVTFHATLQLFVHRIREQENNPPAYQCRQYEEAQNYEIIDIIRS